MGRSLTTFTTIKSPSLCAELRWPSLPQPPARFSYRSSGGARSRDDGSVELLPSTLNDRLGLLALEYLPSDNIEKAGFDMFDPSDFDPRLAVGYPTMRAWMHDYDGTGYRTASAFIQWIDSKRGRLDPVETSELDRSGVLGDIGIPFFSYGYPATCTTPPLTTRTARSG